MHYLVNDGQMLFAGCAFSKRGRRCSEPDGKADRGVSGRGRECNASKRMARTARRCVKVVGRRRQKQDRSMTEASADVLSAPDVFVIVKLET